jgi:hypothetical protein
VGQSTYADIIGVGKIPAQRQALLRKDAFQVLPVKNSHCRKLLENPNNGTLHKRKQGLILMGKSPSGWFSNGNCYVAAAHPSPKRRLRLCRGGVGQGREQNEYGEIEKKPG